MQKIYSRINWENFPSEKTAVNESNLNRMDLGLDNLDDRVIALDAEKFNTETANTLIKDWVIDEQTGVITITKLNGEKILFDLNIEKIPVDFKLSEDGILTMTTDDGTPYTANIGAMIPVLTFEDSDEIVVSVSGSGVNKTYSFSIKAGSVTEDKLRPNFLADVKTEVAKAQASQSAAAQSASDASSGATLAESYTHGGTGTRDGEDTDNARYYMEQAKAVSAVDIATTEKAGIVKPDGTTITSDEDGTLHGAAEVTVDTALSSESTNPVQNKVVTSNLTDLRKGAVANLLNPDMPTKTNNGVTCTNNGDGTYTLNGTATAEAQFALVNNRSELYKRIVGKNILFLNGGHKWSRDYRILFNVSNSDFTKCGTEKYDGDSFVVPSGYEKAVVDIHVKTGVTVNNLVVKPMITFDLDATNDDFVPYTGDTGRLNGDVAELQDSKADKTEVPKLVKVDGKTVFLSEDGVLSAKGGGATITPKPTVNPQIKNDDKKVVITWEDPTNTVIEGSTFSTWAGTKLVMKESGYPTSPDDGTVLVDNTTRDKYKTTGFEKSGLTNDKQYYFALFPYSTDGAYNYDSGNRLLGEPTELKIVTFADGTDAEIAKMIQAHYNDKINISDYWAVGDTRTVSLSAMSATGVGESHRAQDVQFVIGDFDHDYLATPINGHAKAAVTLLQKDCLMDASNASNPVNGSGNTENGYMNSSATNEGGWKNCARRAWCNNVFFASLPSIWQSMVKTVNKKSGTGGGSSSGTETTQDKIFLAAEIEIFGSAAYSVSGEGAQYQYYKNATANRYKMPKWGSSYVSNIYWERSPHSGVSADFCRLGNNGYVDTNIASQARGVATCLCI